MSSLMLSCNFNISLVEVIAFEQQLGFYVPRTGIGKAVSHIKPRWVPALSIPIKSADGRFYNLLRNANRFADERVRMLKSLNQLQHLIKVCAA